LALVLLSAGWLESTPAQERVAPRKGGVLKVALNAEPPSLDLQWSTSLTAQQIGWHIYETLYTLDRQYNPIPLLAEGHTVSDDGRQYVIRLRRGVRFHNGREMTSADVVGSLRRWGRVSAVGKTVWSSVLSVEPSGPSAVTLSLREPSHSLLSVLARPVNAAAIYPKEVVEAAGDGQIREFVGTGPFRFVEHRPDQYVRVARFDDYAARAEPPDGYGGRRTAYVDQILFMPVTEVSTRLNGVESREFHYAHQIAPESYERVLRSAEVEPQIVKPAIWPAVVLNHRQGLMTSKKIRQAFQAALDMEPVLAAGIGHRAFYRVDGALFFPEQPLWYSTGGLAGYDQKNRAKATQLLRESGYRGEPVRWLTTRDFEHMYRAAVVVKQQVEDAGFVVDLQVVDSATMIKRRSVPELFDAFSTAFGFSPDPALSSALACAWPGWWCNEEKERLLAQVNRTGDLRERQALMDKIQVLFYEDVGRVKLGDAFWLDVSRRELRGVRATYDLAFWNVWLAAP
jgi:peptide/nickel transport system substrate-binding protein